MAFKQKTVSAPDETMACRVCAQVKPRSEFSATDGGKYIKHKCRSCVQDANRRVYSGTYQQYLMRLGYSLKYARKKQGYEWEIESEDLIDLWQKQKGRCALTNVIMTHHRDGSGNKAFNASIDRINPEVAYRKDNLQLVCYTVNIIKGSLSPDEFFFWIKSIYEHACD